MPFDPKLIHEDNADFDAEADLQLSADLALMAEQLGDDAARLAATYPPKFVATRSSGFTNRLKPVTTSGWLTRSLAGTALAAGLVTISLVASNSYQSTTHAPQPTGGETPASGQRKLASVQRATSPPQVPVSPASWLGDTSGPELEALMDLWEQEQPAVRSLSF